MLLRSLEAIKDYKLLEIGKYKVDQIRNKNVETSLQNTGFKKVCHTDFDSDHDWQL